MHKKILIINGHPRKDSFNFVLANAYKRGAEKSKAEVKVLNIVDLEFDKFNTVFDNKQCPEDIKKAQNLIAWADHTVWVYPTWWYNMPALMKAFIEQSFLSGFGFEYLKSKKNVRWNKFLKGKTAHIISTMDAPPWYYIYFLGDPATKNFRAIFDFCGIKLKKRTFLGAVKTSNLELREKWIKQVEKLGEKLK